MFDFKTELANIVAQMTRQGKMNFLDGATNEQINTFETKHGFALPEQYKTWLLFSDGGECFLPAGVQLYGVAHKPFIDVNDNDRPNDNYIVLGALASGDPILFKKGEEKIAIYNHEAACIETDEVYEDFLAFLKDLPDILGIES